jgi:hypothetical protein
MNSQIDSKNTEVTNIRRQFQQDCLLSSHGFTFLASPQKLLEFRAGFVTDSEGFPVPLSSQDTALLVLELEERWTEARRSYYTRMSRVDLTSLTRTEDHHEENTM